MQGAARRLTPGEFEYLLANETLFALGVSVKDTFAEGHSDYQLNH